MPTDIEVTAIMTPTEAIQGHITETVNTTTGVLHDAISPVLIFFAMTHHIDNHPYIGVHQLIQKIAAAPDHTLCINQVRKLCISVYAHPSRTPAKPQGRRHPIVTIDDTTNRLIQHR